MIETTTMLSSAQAVIKGLTATNKYLPSWLLYNDEGDKLFQEITVLPEYYLTRSETEILKTYSRNIFNILFAQSPTWDIIELGPGDGTKTQILLDVLVNNGLDINYYGVDISENVLDILQSNLENAFPKLPVSTVKLEYFEGIDFINNLNKRPKVVLFMGANIGNFELNQAQNFLSSISERLHPRDMLLVGFDLMKSPSVISAAYNDSLGITAAFNFNLLKRLNSEFNANFRIRDFEHYPTYDPITGSAKSFLISKKKQIVDLSSLDIQISFKLWEPIYTEISQKYSKLMIRELANSVGLRMLYSFSDSKDYFSVELLEGNQ